MACAQSYPVVYALHSEGFACVAFYDQLTHRNPDLALDIGRKLEVIGSQNEWLNVRLGKPHFENRVGWVKQKNTSAEEPPSEYRKLSLAMIPTCNGLGAVAEVGSIIYARQAQGFPLVAFYKELANQKSDVALEIGEKLEVIGEHNEWYNVRLDAHAFNGHEGWVKKANTCADAREPSKIMFTRQADGHATVAFYNQPSDDTPSLAPGNGVKLEVVDERDEWYNVRLLAPHFNRRSGWVKKRNTHLGEPCRALCGKPSWNGEEGQFCSGVCKSQDVEMVKVKSGQQMEFALSNAHQAWVKLRASVMMGSSLRKHVDPNVPSLWCVRVTKQQAVGCFLGAKVNLLGEGMDHAELSKIPDDKCLNVMHSKRVLVLGIMSFRNDQPEGEDVMNWEPSGMNWMPSAQTKLHLHDMLYVGGRKEGVEALAEVVGEQLELDERVEIRAVPVPQHWVGSQLGRKKETRPNGLHLHRICGAQVLGLRDADGSHLDLFPNSDTELKENQEMLFLYSSASYPGITFEFELPAELQSAQKFKSRKALMDGGGMMGALCTACYEGLQDKPQRTLPCGHMFHAECVQEYIETHNQCPTCRAKVWRNVRLESGAWVRMDVNLAPKAAAPKPPGRRVPGPALARDGAAPPAPPAPAGAAYPAAAAPFEEADPAFEPSAWAGSGASPPDSAEAVQLKMVDAVVMPSAQAAAGA